MIGADKNVGLFFRSGIGALNGLCERFDIQWMFEVWLDRAAGGLPFLFHQNAEELIVCCR